MRTTARLPDDLCTEVRVTAASTGTTVTAFQEQTVRDALERRSAAPREPFRLRPFTGDGLLPAVDVDDSASLLALMDADDRA